MLLHASAQTTDCYTVCFKWTQSTWTLAHGFCGPSGSLPWQRRQIIYVDTSDEPRLHTTKRGRGADLIRERADLVLDNDGPFEVSVKKLLSFASSMKVTETT